MPQASLRFFIRSSRPARQIFSFTSSFNKTRKSEFWRFAEGFGKLVVAPALIAVLAVELLAWRTGADVTSSVTDIAELQHGDPNLVWTGPGQLYGPLALARIKIEQPQIIMIGHSRCGQLRSMMFRPYTFHNACVVAWTFDQIKTMIDLATRSGGPNIVMFTLDYFMLGEAYAKRWREKAFMDFAPPQRKHRDGLLSLASAFNRHPGAMLGAMPSYLLGRAHEPANGLELLGPDAIVAQSSLFRSDGSLLYDARTRAQAEKNNQEPARLIATVDQGDGLQPGAAQLKALQEIGDLGRQRKLTIVGIQLPVIQGAVDVLESNTDWRGHYRAEDRGTWRLLRSTGARQQFKALGIDFFDLTHDSVAKEPRAFIDPAHPSEYGTGKALLDALETDSELRAIFPRLDIAALQTALDAAKHDDRLFDVYGAQF
jgi:hypothetical protein